MCSPKSSRNVASCAALALVFCSIVPATLEAQQRGFSIGADLGVVQPSLGSREKEFWRGIGSFHAGAMAGLSVGYGWSQWGLSAALNTARPSVGDRGARALGAAALLHWRLPVQPAGWSPDVGVGYIRESLGGVSATQAEIRTDFLDRNGIGGIPSESHPTSMIGNGIRFDIAAERDLTRSVALRMFAGTDLITFGTVSYRQEDFTLHGADRSNLIRVGLGLRFRPRGSGSPSQLP
jgi:hypothetical protein